jgi:hypothetical protein
MTNHVAISLPATTWGNGSIVTMNFTIGPVNHDDLATP